MSTGTVVKDGGPYYPECRHPNVDVTAKRCAYCGKDLTKDEIDERLAEGWTP